MKVYCNINGKEESFDFMIGNSNLASMKDHIIRLLKSYANGRYGHGAIVSDIKWN